tara:strand:- start:14893 stop:24063 length:9171 start_codon:yes stop_codon:yes gene_type:complete
MNDDNGYKILEILSSNEVSKDVGVSMTPEEMISLSEEFGDDYVGLIQSFGKEYHNKEIDNDIATEYLETLYTDGVLKKKNSFESEFPTDTISPSGDGPSVSSEEGDEFLSNAFGDVVDGVYNMFPLNNSTKDSNFYGFEWNQDGYFNAGYTERVFKGIFGSFDGRPNYDQNRYVIVDPSTGKYFVNGVMVDDLSELSKLDYEQAWVNARNNDIEGIPGEHDYGITSEFDENRNFEKYNIPAEHNMYWSNEYLFNEANPRKTEYIKHPNQITYPYGGANYDIYEFSGGGDDKISSSLGRRDGTAGPNATIDGTMIGDGFHAPYFESNTADYWKTTSKQEGHEVGQIKYNHWDMDANYRLPTLGVLEELGEHQYFYSSVAGGAKSYEGLIPKKRLENMIRKGHTIENPYLKGEEANDILLFTMQVSSALGDGLFYASKDWNKDVYRMNHIIRELIIDKRRNPGDRKYHTSERDAELYKKEKGRELTSGASFMVSKFNEDGQRIYDELLDIYKDIRENVLDAEFGVVQAREYYMQSSMLDGNSFFDAVVLNDPSITDNFFHGISGATKNPIIELYSAGSSDKFNPENVVLNRWSRARYKQDFHDLQMWQQMDMLDELFNEDSEGYNEDRVKEFEQDIKEEMDIYEELFLSIPRDKPGWSKDSVDQEKELYKKLKKLSGYLNLPEDEQNKGAIDSLKSEIKGLRDDMAWIGDEFYDENGMRIDKPTLEQMEESDPKGADRIKTFTSDFKQRLAEFEGYYDNEGNWVVPDIVDILALYHQAAAEYKYLENLEENYEITLSNGKKITLGQIIDQPYVYNAAFSDYYLDKMQQMVGDKSEIEKARGQIDSITNEDRKRMRLIHESYLKQKDRVNLDILAAGRFVLLNSDPGTVDYEGGWYKSLGEGLAEGFMNLFGLYEFTHGERYDYDSVIDINRRMVNWMQENNIPVTEAQLESFERTWNEEAMYGLGASIPLILAISLVTGPATGLASRTFIGAGSRLSANLLSRYQGFSRVGGWQHNTMTAKSIRDAYNATMISLRNNGTMGHFALRLAEEMGKGYFSFKLAGAHPEMGAGIHAGTMTFNAIFPQTKLSRWLFWDKSSPINVRPDARPLFKDGAFLGWADEAGNMIRNLGPTPLNYTPMYTKAVEKMLQFSHATAGGTLGMYVGEVFDHAARNGVNLDAIFKDVFGIGIQDDKYAWLDKFTMTLYLSAIFSSVQTYKMESAIENVLVRYSKDMTVPEGVRDQLTSYLSSYNRHKLTHQTDFKKMVSTTKGTEKWKNILLRDPYSQYYNIDIDKAGNITARELTISDGYFTKESFNFNKNTNTWEAKIPNVDLSFTIKRFPKNDPVNPGAFYMRTHRTGQYTSELVKKAKELGLKVEAVGDKEIVVLGKSKAEVIEYLNNYMLEKVGRQQADIVRTENPLAGVFDYIGEYNRKSINKEQMMMHEKNGFSIYNDRAGNQQGREGYLVRMFPETRIEITSDGNLAGTIPGMNINVTGLKGKPKHRVIETYKKMFEEVLLGSSVLDIVTYNHGGKQYIEIMGRTQSSQHASILAKNYNIGEILNLKDLSSTKVDIEGVDINKDGNIESILTRKNKLDFNNSGLKNIDPNNTYFQKSFAERIADFENVAFTEQSRIESAFKVQNILKNIQSSGTKTSNANFWSEKFYSNLLKELASESVPTVEKAFDNSLLKYKEYITKLENNIKNSKSPSRKSVDKLKFGQDYLSKIEGMGKEKFIELITPNYYLEGVNARHVSDGVIKATEEFLSFEHKPTEPVYNIDFSRYKYDKDGKLVEKTPEEIARDATELLNSHRKKQVMEYFNRWRDKNSDDYFSKKYEHLRTKFGEKIWDSKTKFKETLLFKNSILRDFYKNIEKENPELALWLQSKGMESVALTNTLKGASGWSKVLTKDVRNMFNGLKVSEKILFEDIAWSRHIISMDRAKDNFKIELDKSIDELNFMVQNKFSAKQIESAFNKLKQQAESGTTYALNRHKITVREVDGVYGLYRIEYNEQGNTLIRELIPKSQLKNGEIDVLQYADLYHRTTESGQIYFKLPWRMEHGRVHDKDMYYDKESATDFLNQLKKGGVTKYDKINSKVDIMFEHHKMLAKEMLDAGIINMDAYKTMLERDYIPRDFVESIKNTKNSSAKNKEGFEAENIFADLQLLKGGSAGQLNLDLSNLTINKTQAITQMIFQNKQRANLAEFIQISEMSAKKYNDTGFLDFGFSLNLGAGKDIKTRARELGLSETQAIDYVQIEYRANGKSEHFALHKDMYNSMMKENFWTTNPNASKYVSMFSGSYYTRLTSTTLNPLFAVRNFFRDSQHILFNTDAYSIHLPTALRQFTGDMVKVSSSAFSLRKSNNPLIQDFARHGGSMDFLTTQGRRVGSEANPYLSDGVMDKYINKKLPGWQYLYTVRNTTRNHLRRFTEVFSYLGESSEMFTRLAVYERAIGDRVKAFEKYNERPPTTSELEIIKRRSADDARATLDFGQGGTFTKLLDAFIPYTNAATQGFRVTKDYWLNNPKKAAYKWTQMATYTAGLNMYNWEAHPDEMERLWRNEPWVPLNNFLFFIPGWVDEEGHPQAIKIKKEYTLIPSAALIEGMVSEQYTGVNYTQQGDWNPFIDDKEQNVIMQSVTDAIPFGGGVDIPFLAEHVPFVRAWFGSKHNYDYFRQERIYHNNYLGDEAKALDLIYPGEGNPTNQFYGDLANLLPFEMSGKDYEVMLREYGIGKGYIFDLALYGYNKMFDQPTQTELKMEFNNTINPIINENIEQILGPFFDDMVHSIDMSASAAPSEITEAWQNKVDEATLLDEINDVLMKQHTTFYYNMVEKALNEIPDLALSELDEQTYVIDNIRGEFKRYIYSQFFEGKDGYKYESLKGTEELENKLESFMKNTEHMIIYQKNDINRDIINIHKLVKSGQVQEAALNYYALLQSVPEESMYKYEQQLFNLGVYDPQKKNPFWKEIDYLVNGGGYESYLSGLSKRERFLMEVTDAIFKSAKFNEHYQAGHVDFLGIDIEQIEYFIDWQNIPEDKLTEDGDLTEEYKEELKDSVTEKYNEGAITYGNYIK